MLKAILHLISPFILKMLMSDLEQFLSHYLNTLLNEYQTQKYIRMLSTTCKLIIFLNFVKKLNNK